MFNQGQLFHLLDHLKCTADGIDQIPAGFLSYLQLSTPLDDLINRSVSLAYMYVPDHWKTAISLINPIPKVPKP